MRKSFIVLVSALSLLVSPAWAAADQGSPGSRATERPPESVQRGAFSHLQQTVTPQATAVGEYRIDYGYDLDSYLCREDSPLDFSIQVPDSFGPVDAQGAPVPGNSLYGKSVSVTMRVYDVDEQYGEVDYLYVNGHRQARKLSGADDQWSINTYSIPASQLHLPTAGNPRGTNDFSIDIDTTDDGWCVQVDYAVLSMRALVNTTPPVIFVHGITGNNGPDGESSMHNFKEAFVVKVPTVAGRVAAPPLTATGSIEQNATLLAQKIDDLTSPEVGKRVTIVAHSMGGLAARKYIWDHPSRVDKLVMVATPNGGSELADIACYARKAPWYKQNNMTLLVSRFTRQFGPCDSAADGLYQLQTGYVRGTFNSQIPDRGTTSYATIAGMGNNVTSMVLPGEDDGAVTVDNVHWLADDRSDHRGLHTSLSPVLNLTHSGLIETSSPAIDMSVCWLYGSTNPGCGGGGGWAPSKSAQTNDTTIDNWVEAEGPAGDIAAGATQTFDLEVPAGQGGSLLVYSTSDDLQLSISGGSSFTPTTMFSEPAAVTGFTGPQTLTVHNSGTQTQGFIGFLQVQSDRALSVVAPGLVRPLTDVEVQATLQPVVAGDAPQWKLTDSNGDEVARGSYAESTPGSGQWNARFTSPASGDYSLTSWVEGEEPRIDNRPLLVNNDAALGALQWDTPVDTNGNALFDRLDATFAVDVNQSADYVVAAALVDDGGTVVSTGSGAASLAEGRQQIDVSFDGEAIYKSGVDGPWHVRDLTLSRADGTMVDTIGDAGGTSALPYRSFEHAAVALQPTVIDHGTDSNGNGTFDTLDVTVQADVVDTGDYDVNARLVDMEGNEISLAQNTVSLAAGTQDVTLSFSGYDISGSTKDGPYKVVDFSIYPTSGVGTGVSVIDLHTTAAYQSAEFEKVPDPEPRPPRSVQATAGDASAVVTWEAPSDPGETPIDHYVVTPQPNAPGCVSETLTCQVSGLTNGTAYTFTVVAVNQSGWESLPSEPSAPVTPTARVTPTPTPTPTGTPTPSPSVSAIPSPSQSAEIPPGAVNGLRKTVHKGKKSAKITIRWTAAPRAYAHQVRLAIGKKKYGAWRSVPTTSFVFKVKSGKRYRVQVRGVGTTTMGPIRTIRVKAPKH